MSRWRVAGVMPLKYSSATMRPSCSTRNPSVQVRRSTLGDRDPLARSGGEREVVEADRPPLEAARRPFPTPDPLRPYEGGHMLERPAVVRRRLPVPERHAFVGRRRAAAHEPQLGGRLGGVGDHALGPSLGVSGVGATPRRVVRRCSRRVARLGRLVGVEPRLEPADLLRGPGGLRRGDGGPVGALRLVGRPPRPRPGPRPGPRALGRRRRPVPRVVPRPGRRSSTPAPGRSLARTDRRGRPARTPARSAAGPPAPRAAT